MEGSSPSTETATTAAPAKAGNKKILLIGGIVAGVAIVLALIVAALALSGAFGTNTAGTGPVLIKNTDAQALAAELNSAIVDSIEKSDTGQINWLSSSQEIDSAEVTMNLVASTETGDFTVKASGGFEKEANNQYALQTKMDVTMRQDGKDLLIPIDVVIKNKVVYFRVNDIPDEILQGQMAALALLENRWLKYDLEAIEQQAASFGVSSGLFADMDAEERAELLSDLRANPMLQNAKATNNRTVEGVSLKCTSADLNPEFFNTLAKTATSSASAKAIPMEICIAADGRAPMYVKAEAEDTSGNATFDISLFNVGKKINIQAPTENVTDLMQLLGGSSL